MVRRLEPGMILTSFSGPGGPEKSEVFSVKWCTTRLKPTVEPMPMAPIASNAISTAASALALDRRCPLRGGAVVPVTAPHYSRRRRGDGFPGGRAGGTFGVQRGLQ